VACGGEGLLGEGVAEEDYVGECHCSMRGKKRGSGEAGIRKRGAIKGLATR
jgi:hypothetical protein